MVAVGRPLALFGAATSRSPIHGLHRSHLFSVTTFLQIWGGGCYLTNKILFALSDGRKRGVRIAGWIVYLLGVPPWVMILIAERNWIAASIEAGGVPSMLLGLYNACQPGNTSHRKLDVVASFFTYTALVVGVGFSLWERGGLTSLTQGLEIGVTVGFLMGSYLLAKRNPRGWLYFMLMNISMAALMTIQHKPILVVQQLLSLGFVIYGFIRPTKTN